MDFLKAIDPEIHDAIAREAARQNEGLELIAAAGAPTIVLSSASEAHRDAPRGHVTVLRARDLAELPVDDVHRAVANLVPPA